MGSKMTGRKIKELTVCAMLTSLALGLSYVERYIPLQLFVPLPGVKLGLANIAIMTALYFMSPREAFLIMFLRCIIGAAFGGGIVGFAMSVSGGILSILTMSAAKRSRGLSVYGVSILGAAAHSTGQVIAAAVLINSFGIFIYLAFLLLVSIVSGVCTGAVTAFTLKALIKAEGEISV